MNETRGITTEKAKAAAGLAQRRAADPAVSAWTSASAGTGKTKVLVDRVLRLLLDGALPQRILCITFTKAAAAEMANRIDRALADWAVADEPTLTRLLNDLTGEPPHAKRLDTARSLFATVLEAPGGLQIFTIHAFCQTVLKRFPIEARLAPHFTVIDERDAGAAMADARRAVIEAARNNPGGDLAEALATVASFATEDSFAAQLDVLVKQPERLREGLAGGFAAFKRRLHEALGLDPAETEASAVAAACKGVAARDARLAIAAKAMLAGGGVRDADNGQRIADWLAAKERPGLFAAYLCAFFTEGGAGPRRKDLLAKKTAASVAGAAEALAAEAERLDAVRVRCKAARTANATAALFCLAGAVLAHYDHYKHARAALDFGDLIAHARDLLAAEGRAAWVLWKLDGGIDHVLVDEAQDTSAAQWELIRLLVDEFFAGAGAERAHLPLGRTLFVVGDFKQSIFSFQGAAPAEFHAMHDYFHERARAAQLTWEIVPLQVSFRSTPAVLEAVDTVFRLELARAGVETQELVHLSARGALAGLVEVWPTVKPRDTGPETAWREAQPEGAVPEPAAVLADHIAGRIEGWITRKEQLNSLGRAIHAGDVLILVRRRGEFMSAMVSALKKRGVPVTGVDRMVLSEQLAVQDLVALGRFLLLPDDDLALANVLKGPFFGFDDDQHLFPLAYERGKQSLWQRLGELAGKNADFGAARARLEELLKRADFAPPYELFARVIEAEGGRRDILARLGPDAEDPLDEFLDLALEFQRQHAPSLEGFLHWLGQSDTDIKRDFDQSGRDEVRVMTVHGAKGLQAPIVFLADTLALPQDDARVLWPEKGATPGTIEAVPLFAPIRADEIPEAGRRRAELQRLSMEEYRRLLYVALTRAADRLYIGGYETMHGVREGCWYDLVAKAFAGVEPVDFPFDAHWSGKGWRIERHGKAAKPAEPPIGRRDTAVTVDDWAKTPPPPEAPPPRPLAPSQPAEEEPPVRSPFADEKRFRRGRLVHRLLQTLPDLPPASRRTAALRYLKRPGIGLVGDEIEPIIAETLALFDDPATAALFGPGSLAEVPVTGVLGAHVVSGQVDRLAIGDEILIVDYKTNRAPPPAPPPVYVKQMAAYSALLGRIYPGRKVRCFLLWTAGPALAELSPGDLERASTETAGA